MKTKILLLLGLWCFIFSPGLQSQSWNQLGPLIELFSQEERDEYEGELDELRRRLLFNRNDGLQLGDLDSGPAIDSLISHLSGHGLETPDSLTDVWNLNRGQLDSLLGRGLFSTEDSLALSDQFDFVNGEWYNELDSLQRVINGEFPDLNRDLLSNGENRTEAFSGNLGYAINSLSRRSGDYRDGIPVQGLDSLTEVLDTTLFAAGMDIEIAFGQESAQVGFYRESYSARSSLIRVASVPTYRETLTYRWSMEGSFFSVAEDLTFETNSSLAQGLNPFICNANAAMLYLPYFGLIGDGTAEFRFYTSIGVDVSAYVPPHIREDDPRTLDNVGLTTGYGPEIGAGFIINVAGINIYTYGTIASGSVINAPDNYRYDAAAVHAGLRIGDAVTARYTQGRATWAPNEDKAVKYNRFTVGIILDSLNR